MKKLYGGRNWRMWAMMGLLLGVLAAMAQGQAEEGVNLPEGGQEITLWFTIKAGGIVGLIIILQSVAAVALIIEHFLTIRYDRMIPGELAEKVEECLADKNLPHAKTLCEEDGSYLAEVLHAGLGQVGGAFGYFDIQNAVQEASERSLGKLHRKLEFLAFIAASAPMFGLLGTVTGMIRSFNEIARTEGMAKPSQLAGGISEALITTCFGLIVAIPTMFFVSFFRNRIDSYVSEAETVVEKVMERFRKEGV